MLKPLVVSDVTTVTPELRTPHATTTAAAATNKVGAAAATKVGAVTVCAPTARLLSQQDMYFRIVFFLYSLSLTLYILQVIVSSVHPPSPESFSSSTLKFKTVVFLYYLSRRSAPTSLTAASPAISVASSTRTVVSAAPSTPEFIPAKVIVCLFFFFSFLFFVRLRRLIYFLCKICCKRACTRNILYHFPHFFFIFLKLLVIFIFITTTGQSRVRQGSAVICWAHF